MPALYFNLTHKAALDEIAALVAMIRSNEIGHVATENNPFQWPISLTAWHLMPEDASISVLM